MLGFYIALPFLLFALYRLFVGLYNYFKRPFLPLGTPVDGTSVSVLVYARNAEKSIGNLLTSLTNQDLKDLEVLIFNDQSADKTVEIIGQFASDKRIRLFNGNDIGNGWNRRAFAFEKLSQIAKGQYIAFVNYDICFDNQMIANAVANMQQKSLSLLAIYPKPYSKGFWNGIQIAAINWFWFSHISALNLFTDRRGVGSGMVNPLIVAESKSFKDSRLFDKYKETESPESEISALAFGQKNAETLLGDDSLTFDVELVHGSVSLYSQHFLDGFFKKRNNLIISSVAMGLGIILVIFLLPFPLVFLYLFALIYSQILIAMLTQRSIILSLLVMPIQYFVLVKGLVTAIKKSGKQAHHSLNSKVE